MRLFLQFLTACFFLASCNNKADEAPAMVKGKMLVTLPVSPAKVKGTYTGDFKGTPLSLTLNYVSDSHASGYNIHKGLTRNLSGTIEAAAGGLHLLLSEPGNNPYDGKFDFLLDTTKGTVKGTWTPLKKGDATSFVLNKEAAPKEDEQYGMVFFDTLQNYLTIKPDGSCTYSYVADTLATTQRTTVRGNYTKEKNMLTVFWQKNEAFPSGKSVFKLIEKKPYPDEPDYVERSLKGEGRMFAQNND